MTYPAFRNADTHSAHTTVARPRERHYRHFLFLLGDEYSVSEAAFHCRLSRSAIYKRRAIDPAFREAMDVIRAGDVMACPHCGEKVA